MKYKITIFILLVFSVLVYAQNTIIWKITNQKNEKTSYLIGSFHQLGENFITKYPKIEEIISKSELTFFESLTIDTLATNHIINSRKNDDDIKKHFNKSQIKKLENYVSKSGMNIYRMTPIELLFKVQQKYTKVVCKTVENNEKYDHFDSFLISLADKHNIKKIGFETLEEQIELLNKQYNSFTWKDQKKNILYYFDNLSSTNPNRNDKENLCGFADKYKKFDLNYQFNSSTDLKTFLVERNNNWMNEIVPYLEQKNVLITVGFLHLMYQEGLINQLRLKGFIVEPEKMN